MTATLTGQVTPGARAASNAHPPYLGARSGSTGAALTPSTPAPFALLEHVELGARVKLWGRRELSRFGPRFVAEHVQIADPAEGSVA